MIQFAINKLRIKTLHYYFIRKVNHVFTNVVAFIIILQILDVFTAIKYSIFKNPYSVITQISKIKVWNNLRKIHFFHNNRVYMCVNISSITIRKI